MTNHPNRSKQQQAKHTPGPWHLIKNGPATSSVSASGQWIATLSTRNNIERANARLIAAAPELLAALKYMVAAQAMRWDAADRRVSLEQASAAIAKAEGR